MSADAVVANLNRALQAREESGDPARRIGRVSRVIAVDDYDDYTVKVVMTEPDPDLPEALASPALAIASPAAFDRLSDDPVGSGPYEFASVQQDRATFRRFDGYWDPMAAKAAGLEMIAIPDGTTRANALRGGQVDAMTGLAHHAFDISSIETDPGFVVEKVDAPVSMQLL